MATTDELKAQLANAKARQAKATLTEEETDQAKLLAEITEAEGAARADEAKRRALLGASREEEARKAAAGKYLVKYYDLAALLPEADPAKLPGEGVLVVRSPPTIPVDALGVFYREIEAGDRMLVAIYTDLVCSSVVFPNVADHDTGMLFRNFLESSIGAGTSMGIGDAVTALGGVRGKRTKRGRG